jgi:hypothetical protein
MTGNGPAGDTPGPDGPDGPARPARSEGSEGSEGSARPEDSAKAKDLARPGLPDDEWAGDEWTDDDWPDDDWPDGAPPVPGWPAPPPPSARHGGGPGWRSYPVMVAVVAVVAAAIGAAVVLLVGNGPSTSPSAAMAPNGSPSSVAPGPGTGGGGIPGGGPVGGSGGNLVQALIVGKVTAVSSTSISVTGQGNTITAAVTGSTKFSGKAHSISDIKVGDQVLAQLTGTGSTFTATTIQDPASIS